MDQDNQDNENNSPIGHLKAVASGLIGPPIIIATWLAKYKYAVEIPDYVSQALIGFFCTIVVWFTPHGGK